MTPGPGVAGRVHPWSDLLSLVGATPSGHGIATVVSDEQRTADERGRCPGA